MASAVVKAAIKLKPLATAVNEQQTDKANSSSKALGLMTVNELSSCTNKAGCSAGVYTSALEASTSLDPRDYVWGTPNQQQQQHLYQQFMQLAFMYCSLSQHPQAMYQAAAAQTAFPMGMPGYHSLSQARLFPGFMPPFPGFPPSAMSNGQCMNPRMDGQVVAPAPSQGQQAPHAQPAPAKSAPARADSAKPAKAAAASLFKKASQNKAKAAKAPGASIAAQELCGPCRIEDIELDAEDIRRLLEDDEPFMQGMDSDCGASEDTEGSNNSANTADGQLAADAAKRRSHSVTAQDMAFMAEATDNMPLNLSSFDMEFGNEFNAGLHHMANFEELDLDSLMGTDHQVGYLAPAKMESSNLDDLPAAVAATTTPRSSRSSIVKLPRVRGGVQKSNSKCSLPNKNTTKKLASHADDTFAADISRLLGEDNKCSMDWELDLDLENPFSTPVHVL